MGIQLHVSVLYIGHRQVVLQTYQAAIRYVRGVPWGGGNRILSYSSGWQTMPPTTVRRDLAPPRAPHAHTI
jgi:hypothetical protein